MANVPDKPTVDGIEAALGRPLGGRRHLPLRPHAAPPGDRCGDAAAERRRVLDRHPAADRVGLDPHGHTCSGTPSSTPSPATSACAAQGVFFPIGWDDNGLATERRVQNYYGVRCDPTQPYDPDFTPPFRGDVPATKNDDHREIPVARPNFIALCQRADRNRRGSVRGAVPASRPVLRLVDAVHHDRRAQPPRQPSGVPPQPRPRRGLQRRGTDGVGRRRPHRRRPGRDRGSRASRAPTTSSPSTAPTATCSSTPPGPS